MRPKRQGNNVIPVANQDLKYKSEQEHTWVEFQAGVSLVPFPGTSVSLLVPLTGMCPCLHGAPGRGPVLCPFQPLPSTQPCTLWSLSEPDILLKASCSLWLPRLPSRSSFTSANSTPFFSQDYTQMHLSCEVFSTSSGREQSRLL